MADQQPATPARPGQRDLTAGPIGKTLLAFALPTLGSSILQSLNGSINSVWVGRFLGEDALAATFNANIVMFLLMPFVFGFGMASTILIGQAFGRRDVDGARRVIGTAIGGFLPARDRRRASSAGCSRRRSLGLLATPRGAMPLALAYLRVIFLAMPAALMLVMLMMALRGSGDSLTPLWFMILAGDPRQRAQPGIHRRARPVPAARHRRCARLATVIANYVALIGLGRLHLRPRPAASPARARNCAISCPTAPCSARSSGKGLPMGLQMIVISSSALAPIGLVNREGVETTAAFGVAMQLWTYLQMPAMALGAAVSAMAAQNIGAGSWDRVSRITRSGIIYNLLITGVLVVLLAFADRPALALFLGADSPSLPIARHIQLLATWSFLLFGVTMVLFGTVRANGAVLGPLIILAIGLYPGAARLCLGRLSLARRRCVVAELPGQHPRQHGPRHRLLPPRRLAKGAAALRRSRPMRR